MKEKRELANLSPPSLSLSLPLFLSILHVEKKKKKKQKKKKKKRRRFELLPAADCLRVRREILYHPQLCVSHRAGPQCSRPPVSERCSAWIMRELGSVRSGPGELCRCCCC